MWVKEKLENLNYLLKNRFVIFILFFMLFILTSFLSSGSFLPSTETKDLWFYSGLFMLCFSILFIEPYYTSPKNVITNVVPLILVFLSIKDVFVNIIFWWFAVIIFLFLLMISIIAIAIEDKNKSPEHITNKIADFLKNIAILIGTGKVLYSAVFIYFLLTYYSIQNFYTILLFIFWFFIIIIDTKKIHNKFLIREIKVNNNQIGEIFGVQSKKIFLVKLFEDKKNVTKFDIVKFKYSMQDTKDLVITGIIFDTYLLNQEKWAKILQLKNPRKEDLKFKMDENFVYKVSDEEEIQKISSEIRVKDFIGVVIEGSNIGKIKFEYSKMKEDLQMDDLIELEIGSKKLYYQVITGTTQKEKLEARNEMGYIEGEAIQLGEWSEELLSFQKFGWVPSINTPIFKANTNELTTNDFAYPLYKLGVIPGTSLPSVINLSEAVSHHMALLGVTGAGKSFIAREIIKQLKNDTKIICIDLTGEWKVELSELSPKQLIDSSGLGEVEEIIAKKETATKNKNSEEVLKYKKQIQEKLNIYIKAFADSEDNLSIFELPDLSNTSFILEFTQMFLDSLFLYAKSNQGNKFCIVLEEAHTIIPETSFLGDLGDYSANKGLVSKMGQIALQGRKYGVGFLVIAQRTANVSKTVLTQCNTVVCFQAFDETSFSFLQNYVGKDMVHALPNLKQYHAIVAGKSIKSNMPMIVDLSRN
ncbi:MAG: DUF87 domain-containing protein [Candidatus Buchananbacteria bacterium]|nr:DUF87 domain-containing protein [Candidatus Buchananbacteria bacterium]